MPLPRTLTSLVLMGTLAALRCFAQGDAAAITGVVTDPSGSSVSGATVKIVNKGTGATLQATTSESGLYFMPGLRPALYGVSVSQPGFKSLVRDGVTLSVGHTARVDLALEVGDLSDRVTVTAEASLLESETRRAAR